MILIQETMCDHYHALRIFSKIKPSWEFYAIESLGHSWGLLTGWNPLLARCKAFVMVLTWIGRLFGIML